MARCTKLYDILGVAPDASQKEIQYAYRRAAMRAHPDREGGSTEAFQAVERAGSILLDKEKRAAYDAGEVDGDGAAEVPLEARVRRMVLDIFLKGFCDAGESFENCWRKIRPELVKEREKIVEHRGKLQANLDNIQTAYEDLFIGQEKTLEQAAFAVDMLEGVREAAKLKLTAIDSDIAFVEKALELMIPGRSDGQVSNPVKPTLEALLRQFMDK